MFTLGRVPKYVAISAVVMVLAALTLFLSFAGESRAPSAFAYSTPGHGAFLGVELEEETEYSEGGARVVRVVDDSAADEAGLQEDDIIVGFDGQTIRGPKALTKQLHDRKPGDSVSITVVRDGRERTLDVDLGERSGAHAFSFGDGKFKVFAPGVNVLDCDEDEEDCEDFTFDLGHFGLGGRPLLGVQLVGVTDELREHLGGEEGVGVLVSKVLSGTPAEDAGIEVGDLIVGVDGNEIADHGDCTRALRDLEGETFEVEVIRDGRSMGFDVTIPERDDSRSTGPRAFYFSPNIDLEGLDVHIHDALQQSRSALEDARRQAHGVSSDTMSEARKAFRDALRESRRAQRDNAREIRKAVRKDLDIRNSI